MVSLDGVSAVTTRFDTTDMISRTFTVTNIRTVNVPSTIDLEVLTAQIHQVTLYGPKSEMEELSADSILAQVDCQNLAVSVGQQTVAASIQVPSSSHILQSATIRCSARQAHNNRASISRGSGLSDARQPKENISP